MKKSIVIMLFIFAIVLFGFTGYILFSGDRTLVPFMQLFIAGNMLLLSISEYRKKRRNIARLLFILAFTCLLAGIFSFIVA